MSPQRMSPIAALILVLLCAIWGTSQTAVKIASEGIAPTLNAGLRSTASGGLLMLWCLARGIPFFKLDRRLPWGLLLGLLFSVEFIAAYQGIALTDASRGILFIFISPFVTAIGAHFLAPGERLTLVRVLGLLVAFAGLVVAFADGLSAPRPGQVWGDLLCLTYGVLWGLDTLMMKVSPLKEVTSERALFYALAVSAVLLPLASWAQGESWAIEATSRVLTAFAYTAVVVSFFSYVVFIWFIRRFAATSFGAFMFLSPVFGVITAALVLGEPLSASLLAALALIAVGIFLVNR